MSKTLAVATFLGMLASFADAECANACNGHGKCTSYDMCICNRNWQANDCSERVCMYGLAHVDTPKGDLDMNGMISGPDLPIIDNDFKYPYGTTEQFPSMEDSDLVELPHSGHYYMECSNKGTCDRGSGECSCYDGYDGISCQRASCPGYPDSCSGHGVCKSISQLASASSGNVYKLWDQDKTMGCECDKGYYGPDCSERDCKYGIDPLYLDDIATIKYPIFNFATLAVGLNEDANTNLGADNGNSAPRAMFSNGDSDAKDGYWSIRFFDNHNEDWVTRPIIAGASCDDVIDALESIPNDVIPKNSIYCTRLGHTNAAVREQAWTTSDGQHLSNDPDLTNHHETIWFKMALWEAELGVNVDAENWNAANQNFHESFDTTRKLEAVGGGSNAVSPYLYGYIYKLKFYGNPGAIREPQIDIYLDGIRPSLVSKGASVLGKVITKVWSDGQQGEYKDMFADHCDGVTVTIDVGEEKGFSTSNDEERNHKMVTLGGISGAEAKLLKTCLGPADFDTSNNVEIYNWDYGTKYYPHLIKLVRTVTTYTDGGYYAALYFTKLPMYRFTDTIFDATTNLNLYDPADPNKFGKFVLLNPFVPLDGLTTSSMNVVNDIYGDTYEIYTTKGTFALVSNASEATFDFASNKIYMTNTSYDTLEDTSGASYDGDVSCEIGDNNAYKMSQIFHCLNVTDIFTFLSWDTPYVNPSYINLYTAQRLHQAEYSNSVGSRFPSALAAELPKEMHYFTHSITTDLSTNWGKSIGENKFDAGLNEAANAARAKSFNLYKFFPAAESTYEYVAPCSNRGLCNSESGICECFPGYTSDDCHEQASIAL